MNKIINTKNFIFLTILGSPLYLIRFEIFNIPTNILEIFIGITLVNWIFEIKKSRIKKIDFYILLPILLILSGLLISILVNSNYQTGFGIIKGWFIAPIIFGLIIYNAVKTKKDIENILNYIFVSTILVSSISLLYCFSGRLTFDDRLSAFFLSPNHLAMFLAPGLLIGLIKLLSKKTGSQKKIFLITGSLIVAISLYLTHSYASWLAIILAYFASIIFIAKQKKLRLGCKKIFLVSFLMLIVLLFLQQNNSKFQDLINLNERSSLASRMTIWKSSLKILSDNWIVGIGPGNFQEKYLEYQKYFLPYLEWAVPQPHSLYLAFWLQGGLLGIIGFVWLIYYWINIQFLYLNSSKNKKQLTIILLAIMIYILIHGLADTPYWKNDLSLIFWIIIFLGLIKPNPPASLKQRLFH